MTARNILMAAAGGSTDANYIEDVFSTWLYTGNGSTQTITNGIDLAGKGGLVWLKDRSGASINQHTWVDTNRGVNNWINSASTFEQSPSNILSSYNATGFTLSDSVRSNQSGASYVGWTFRKQPKFFDVVTYTGNGTAGRQIAHNLGSEPGCIIFKRTDSTSDWAVYHRGLNGGSGPEDYKIFLNTTAAQASGAPYVISTLDSTTFTLGSDGSGGGSTLTNVNGATYVAYLFAHNAGGFGLTGTDNVISCGSFMTDGSGNATVDLGYEPQWLMMKGTTAGQPWWQVNNMAGFVAAPGTTTRYLAANSTDAENSWGSVMAPTATGFVTTGLASSTIYIYIAIRRGPMKVPTDGTKVFNVVSQTPSGTTTVTNSFASDMVLSCQRSNGGGWGFNVADKLRGSSIPSGSPYLTTPTTAAEGNFSGYGFNLTNTDIQENFWNVALGVSTPVVYDVFQRAPGFFDEVCYTATGANLNVAHNLQAVPELMIVKARSSAGWNWTVYAAPQGATKRGYLNSTNNFGTSALMWNNTAPTSTVFTVGAGDDTNPSAGVTMVAYLFATCPGVSKVGSYTGTGTTQTINCGFTGGARFVLIKAASTTGNWYVWDSARGIVVGNDPYLVLNSTAAEVTTTDWVDTAATGFELSNAGGNLANSTGVTYLFLAIA